MFYEGGFVGHKASNILYPHQGHSHSGQHHRWIFRTDKAGSQWSVLANGAVRWTVANDPKCGGSADKAQKGTAELRFQVLRDTKVRVSMQGMGEARYERLKISLDNKELLDVIAENVPGVCAVDTCNMCPVKMKPREITLKAGAHRLNLYADTFDGEYHNGCYYDIFFAEVPAVETSEYQKCKSYQCGDPNLQVHPQW